MTDRIETIRNKLLATFQPLECQVLDESAAHAGHAGAASGGGHYRVRLVSARFEGCTRVARHRLVYDCLDDMLRHDIHALALVTLTPTEASL